MQGKCERRGGNINADTANAEVFVGDGCSQGASFGPMALISRRGQGGRIYNNTRTRERLRRKCVKPADHTTFPAEDLLPSPHSDAPCPSIFSPPSRTLQLPPRADAHPQAAPCIPRRRPSPTPAQRHALPEHFRSPTQPRRTPAGCAMHARRPHDTFPVEDLRPPTSQHIPRRRSPPLPFRSASGTKNGTAQCMCDAECLGRPSCGRSFGLVSRALFAAVAGRWRVGVGLRPQPWALRSRRCGRVLRA